MDRTTETCRPHVAGPPCCEPPGHEGPHMFKCCGPSCPGLPWPASVEAHPVQCADGVIEMLRGQMARLQP